MIFTELFSRSGTVLEDPIPGNYFLSVSVVHFECITTTRLRSDSVRGRSHYALIARVSTAPAPHDHLVDEAADRVGSSVNGFMMTTLSSTNCPILLPSAPGLRGWPGARCDRCDYSTISRAFRAQQIASDCVGHCTVRGRSDLWMFWVPQHDDLQPRSKTPCNQRWVHKCGNWALVIIGRPFAKRFALCYRTVVCLSCLSVCLSVCNAGVL